MLRYRHGSEGSQASPVVGLSTHRHPLFVCGRPIRRGAEGLSVGGAPVVVEVASGRIRSVRAVREGHAHGFVGGPKAILGPALSDPHVHLLSAAAARRAFDLGTARPGRISDLFDLLGAWAARTPPGRWVRVRGYDEAFLAEGRHPTAQELEAVVPGRPLRVRHATLHASLLNRTALARLAEVLGPSGGAPHGPEGFVVGREAEIGRLCGSTPEEVAEELAGVGAELAALGISCVDEITATNDASRVAGLARAVADGRLPQRVRVWLRDAGDAPAADRAAAGLVEIAGVKLLPSTARDVRSASFAAAVARARRAGLPVAVHAVEPDVIAGALDVLEAAPAREGGCEAPDRLEHASLCPPVLVERIAALGVAVVTQPGFLVARGAKYAREVEPPLWRWLYPLRSLLRAGVLVAAGSDMPVVAPDPRLSVVGATTRRSREGIVFAEEESVASSDAFDLLVSGPARLRGERNSGESWLRPGAPADLVVWEESAPAPGLAGWRGRATILAGRVYEGARP